MSNFSLNFSAIGPSNSSEVRSKVALMARATRGHRFCGVSTTLRGKDFLLLDLILFKSLVNDLDGMRP